MKITRHGTQGSARYVYHIGTSASATARAGTSCEKRTEENKKFVQYTMDLLSIPNYYIKKGRPHGHRYGKKPGDREYYIANHSRRSARRRSSWVSTTDSYETKSSARTCLTPVELRKFVAKWTTWRTKTTRIT